MSYWVNVAVDGPSGAGKSSVCKAVASMLSYTYIDTGAMYRAVGYCALTSGIDVTNEAQLMAYLPTLTLSFDENNCICANGKCVEDYIRSEQVSLAASSVAKLASVREYCVQMQRVMAQNGNCIMDGRDIASVVLPNANVKIYLDASVDVRGKRRYQQNIEKGMACNLDEVIADIAKRDEQDMNRANSPLVRVKEAYYLDSSDLTFEQTVNQMIEVIQTTINKEVMDD